MANQVELPEDQEYFKLNEVCKLANVQPYMLRFWGTEFAQLEAAKSGTGQRLYTRDQVTVILEIRRLLFDEGLTIAGARKRIAGLQEKGDLPTPVVPEVAGEEPAVEEGAEPVAASERPAAPRSARPKPARASSGKAATGAKAATVDKAPPERVRPLLATLKDVREEVAKIVDELKAGS